MNTAIKTAVIGPAKVVAPHNKSETPPVITEDRRKVGVTLKALANPAYGYYLEKEIIGYLKVLLAADELALPNNGYVEGTELGYPIAVPNPFYWDADPEKTEVLIYHGFEMPEIPSGKHSIVINEAGIGMGVTAISDRNLPPTTDWKARALKDTPFSDAGRKQTQHSGNIAISVRSPSNTIPEEAKCFAELVYMYICAVKQLIIKDDNQIQTIPSISKSATTKDGQTGSSDSWITTITLSYTSEEAVNTGVYAWSKIIEAVVLVKDKADDTLRRDVIPLTGKSK